MTAIPSTPVPPTAASTVKLGREKSSRLRDLRERAILGLLILCGLITVAVTALILWLLISNAVAFFGEAMHDAQGATSTVSLTDYLFGLEWNPLLGSEKHFGMWPLIVGTLQVTAVAMCFALPLGLMVAVWLSEYASPRLRSIIKPTLEIIAGVPTVVFGFFALTFITPALRLAWWADESGQAWNPLDVSSYNVLAAGLAVGIMCLPIVTSMSEDALRAVPRALREASYGLGASRFETSVRVVVPAALSGIVAAFLLAVARAVGETMIVALAAGNLPPNLAEHPGSALDVTEQTQTMTGYMVQIFLGDIEHGGVEYLSTYTVALTLFVITLLLTLVGGVIRTRFRQAYE